MKNTRKIYVVGGGSGYANWMQGAITKRMEDADLVLFTGGEDVDPKLYGEKEHHTTGCNPHRDRYEVGEFRKARALNKHMIGICRGSQFLCAMSGGILVQHQSNSNFIHSIYTEDGEEYLISSTHHQAQYPWRMKEGIDFKVLAWAVGESTFHFGGDNDNLEKAKEKECEIVYYPKIKALGIQGHPEMIFDHINKPESEMYRTISYLRDMLDNFLVDKL